MAWLPAPSLHSTTRTISSRNNFSELKPSEYEPIRHYLDTTTLQVIHSIGYNSKIMVFMNPAKPGPQGDAFCIYIYIHTHISRLSLSLSLYLSIYLSTYLSIYLSVYLSIYLYIYIYKQYQDQKRTRIASASKPKDGPYTV